MYHMYKFQLHLCLWSGTVALTSDNLVTVVNEGAGQSFAVCQNLQLVGLELWCHGLFESYSNTCEKHDLNETDAAEIEQLFRANRENKRQKREK